MIVVEYNDKSSLVISRNNNTRASKDNNFRDGGGVTDCESVDDDIDTGFEGRSCKSVSKNKKYIVPDDSPNVLSFANDRIGVAKHDSELYHWKITKEHKCKNTGIHNFTKNFSKLRKS